MDKQSIQKHRDTNHKKINPKYLKSNRVSVRFSDEVFQRFCELKARTALNNTQLLTELIKDANPVTLESTYRDDLKDLKAQMEATATRKMLIWQLNNIGNNINQIAHAANAHQINVTQEDSQKYSNQFYQILMSASAKAGLDLVNNPKPDVANLVKTLNELKANGGNHDHESH